MTDEILGTREIEAYIRSWNLIPSSGGVFTFTLNGEVLFSKKAVGRHAEEGEIKQIIVDKLDEIKAVRK